LAAAFTIAIPDRVRAQERERIGIATGLINRLFGTREVQRVEPTRRQPQAAAKPRPKKKKRAARAPVESREPPPQAAEVAKHPDARVVLVVGDFLAGGLAEGLATAFVENPDVRVVDRSNGSSGFVRQDFYDWADRIGELITAERPAAVVFMIGANDRQQMDVGEMREAVRSELWNEEYARRADELAKAIAARKVPFLWVGAPPFKTSKMMLDMMAFNDIYRAAAVGAGGEFVDIWDGFVDEEGSYMSNGPDLNGQPARLRANDGINFARPGKRKIAFYAERPLYKLLGIDPALQPGAGDALAVRPAYRMFGPFGPSELQERPDLDILIDPNEVGPIDPARPVALRTPGLDGGVELLGADPAPRLEARTAAERLIIEGIAPAPRTGRADQFAGAQFASASMAVRRMNIDRTLFKATVPSAPRAPAQDRAAGRAVRSDILANPQPPMPARAAPQIREDRLGDDLTAKAVPDVAGSPPPMTSPATMDKASAPGYATGDPSDRSPIRAAPVRPFKRPTSIGPEPNRAPTAVPQPEGQEIAPAEVLSEVPLASADPAAAAADAKPALPDTAPPRGPVPSLLSENVPEATAPQRSAPRKAAPMPVAELPPSRKISADLVSVSTSVTPPSSAPNAASGHQAEHAPARAVFGAPSNDQPGGGPHSRPVLSAGDLPTSAPVRSVPTATPTPSAAPAAAAVTGVQPLAGAGSESVARAGAPLAPAPPPSSANEPVEAPPAADERPGDATMPSTAPVLRTPPSTSDPAAPGSAATPPSPVPPLPRKAALPDGTVLDALDL
jgi:hypothetical protein